MSSFQATVLHQNIRALSRTLQCLSHVGSEVTVEAASDRLILRALAPSHAAYALASLSQTFFARGSFGNFDSSGVSIPSHSQRSTATPTPSPQYDYVKCKVSIKHLMLPFRQRKDIEKVEIDIRNEDNKIWITTHSGGSISGITCKYGIPFESQLNILQADFPRSASHNFLHLKPALLAKNLDNFSPKLNEITLLVDPVDSHSHLADASTGPVLRLKSFEQLPVAPTHSFTGQSLAAEIVHCETAIPYAQLEEYNVDSQLVVEQTFNVREVRSFLSYVESLSNYDVVIRFSEMGNPMLFETIERHTHTRSQTDEERQMLKLELVVATLAESATQTQGTPIQPSPAYPPGPSPLLAPHVHPSSSPFEQKQSAPELQPESDAAMERAQQMLAGSQHNGERPHAEEEEEEVPPTP